jgi:U3 small nucleolar RNA-associated protein 18
LILVSLINALSINVAKNKSSFNILAGGEVFLWDVRGQDCIHRFVDDGSIRGTALAVSPDNRYLAAGSNSGVVNVYNRHSLLSSKTPKPEKIFLNMTTSISSLKFSPTTEVLAMCSEAKDNGIKLAHVPSMTVFNNFPSLSLNLKRVNCVDFSLNGGYMSVGNNGGAANLYRLKHFGNY